MSFFGEERRPIDAKSRIVLPSRFRAQMMDDKGRAELFLTRGTNGCLYLFPTKNWEEIKTRFAGSDFNTEAEKYKQRLFYSSIKFQACDRQGRIVLPESHKKIAGLGSEGVFIGIDDHVELWDTKTWDKYCANGEGEYEKSMSQSSD
ncbi:MAG: division/cell wall cluster transcriptional repressor MraZ [Planctomycetota bacterium]|nr:MAG: division/cell wall cluster transcriptional repressor MraZ [Planctomycetota bacterium]